MPKLIVSINVTLDGFMAGPDCELDWHFKCWTNDMAQALAEQLSKAGTILLGRVTYGGMARHFASAPAGLNTPREDIDFADMLNYYPKIVFSKTLETAHWNNTRIVNGNLRREVLQLKAAPGKDIIIYGSGKLVTALRKMELIDEYRIWVHPVLLGAGKPLFGTGQQPVNLELYKTETFDSGVVILYYKV